MATIIDDQVLKDTGPVTVSQKIETSKICQEITHGTSAEN